MVKPVGDYSDLEEKIRENRERKNSLKEWMSRSVIIGAAVTAGAFGLNGQDKVNAEGNSPIKPNPKEIPVPNIVPENDARTADPWGVNQGEITEEDIIEQSGKFFENQLTEDSKRDLSVPEGTKLGERQGVLKEGEIPVPEFGKGVPEDEVGVVHEYKGIDAGEIPSENKGVRTWQNEDEDLSQIKNYRQSEQNNPTRQAQKDLAMQIMKNNKSNYLE